MISSVRSKLKSSKIAIKSTFVGTFLSIKLHKKPIIIVSLVLIAIALAIGLLVGSIKSLSYAEQGVLFSTVEGNVIAGSSNQNYMGFLGLYSMYLRLPKASFLISFTKQSLNYGYDFEQIIARVQQKTIVIIQAEFLCKINTDTLQDFIEQYGINKNENNIENWLWYLKQQIRNIVIQSTSILSLDQLSSLNLIENINNKSISVNQNQPFKISVINVQIYYPEALKSTLGQEILSLQSELNQLEGVLQQFMNQSNQNQTNIMNQAISKAQLDAQNFKVEKLSTHANNQWNQALAFSRKAINTNESQWEKYLWIYFQNVYNQTYRLEILGL